MKICKAVAALAAVIVLGSAALAQTPAEQVAAPGVTASVTPAPDAASQAQSMRKMEMMSDSMTKMSEMCQMMMKKEAAAMPYVTAAGITIGVLLFVALVLFVILEVQWIIYWNRTLKSQKPTLT